jgi:transketolase
VDGHCVSQIECAINSKDGNICQPTIVLCYTDPCKGFPLLLERAPTLHYVRFKDSEEKKIWEDILMSLDKDNADEKEYPVEMQQGTGNTLKRKLCSKDTQVLKKETSDCHPKPEQTTISGGSNHLETVTRPHRSNLVKWMRSHPKAIVLTADLTSSCEADLLRDELPCQYMSLGMAEQNMMSFAGGLAREGFHPFIHTFAVFVTRRPFDQIAMSIGVPNLPVRLLGFLPGLTTPGGVTHQAIDDIALMRAIPNMIILEVGDATEVESVLDVADSINGPVYIRMWRGQVPRLFPKTEPMKYGVGRLISEGDDVAVITSGICTEQALTFQKLVDTSNNAVSIYHLHLSTLVPFPSQMIVEAAKKTKFGIVVMENHSIVGGIGSATAEVLAEYGIGKKLIRLGIPGVYAHGASCDYLMKEYGFDVTALACAVEKLVGYQISLKSDKDANRESLSVEDRPEDL